MAHHLKIKQSVRTHISNQPLYIKVILLGLAAVLATTVTFLLVQTVRPAHAAPADYSQTDQIGSPVSLNNPMDFTTDASGNYYVADSDAYLIRKYNPAGELVLSFGSGSWSSAVGEFGWVEGIDVKSNGEIYVSDGENGRINVYSPTGTYLRTFGGGQFSYNSDISFAPNGFLYVVDDFQIQIFDTNDTYSATVGTAGTGNGQFGVIADIDIASGGNIYVLEYSPACRVQIFDANFNFIQVFGSCTATPTDIGPGLSTPAALAVTPEGDVLVDSNTFIKKFTSTGTYVTYYGSAGVGSGQIGASGLSGLTVTADGNIHTLEYNYPARIQTFNSAGVYQSQFGNEGSDPSQFNNVWGVVVDTSDNIYVVDSDNSRVQKFSSDGTFLLQFGSKGTGNGQFESPQSVAVSPLNGNVYVTSGGGSPQTARVQIFTSGGVYVGQFGSYGAGDGQFNVSAGIAIDDSGTVFITDTLNQRIQVFNESGTFIRKWTVVVAGLATSRPNAIAIDPAGNLKVTVHDQRNYIHTYAPTGELLGVTGSATYGSGAGQFSGANDMVIDSDGTIYIADTNNGRIQVYDNLGVFVGTIGSVGDGVGQLKYPMSIALDSTNRLIISDGDNNRVPIYSLAPAQTAPTAAQSVAATSPTTNELAVTWQAPASDGNSALTGYNVEYKLQAASTWTSQAVAANSTSHTFTQLAAGTYDVQVFALNAIGTSPAAPAASATVVADPIITPTPDPDPTPAPASPQTESTTSSPTSQSTSQSSSLSEDVPADSSTLPVSDVDDTTLTPVSEQSSSDTTPAVDETTESTASPINGWVVSGIALAAIIAVASTVIFIRKR